MASPVVIVTAVESGFGFLLTITILVLVLLHGRKAYHYLFAAFLLICALWDLGTFLLMIRNDHLEEIQLIGYIIALPAGFIPALLFHFSCLYTGRPLKWAIALVWGYTGVLWLLTLAGIYWKIDGVYAYGWGNMFRVAPSIFDPLGFASWFVVNLSACWLLFTGYKSAPSRLEKRHYLYITLGILVITLAGVKVGVIMGLDIPIVLPLGMFLVDIFNAIIGIAIIKDKLFDITVIVKKGALYSLLAGLLIFIFSLCEHILVTYVSEKIGEHSTLVYLISIAVGIAVLIPVKKRLEHAIEGYFAHKKLEF